MMLVSYEDSGQRVGVVAEGRLVDLASLGGSAPRADRAPTMNDVIERWSDWSSPIRDTVAKIAANPAAMGKPVVGRRLLAPIPRPRRNPFLIAGNYRAHVLAGEKATGIPFSERKTAIFFTKPTGAVAGPTDDVEYDPKLTQKLDYEIELVVVIGRKGRDIPAAEAMSYVFGYTIGNDISARDIQLVKPTTDFLRGKGLDTFFPIGPGIVPKEYLPEYRDLKMRLLLNGVQKQESTPRQMTRDVPEIIADLSRGLTLEPGDLIATGTPSGVLNEGENPVFMRDGDELVSEIEGIGRLVNRIRSIG